MSRLAFLSLSICLLAAILSGCRTASHARANPAPPSTFWNAEHDSPAMEVTAEGTDGRSVRFASLRDSDTNSTTLSQFLTGGADRIPLPESRPEGIRQIDLPRAAAANSIGAF